MSHFASVGLPIIVGVVAVAGTLAGVWLGGRSEGKHWVRTERLRAYSALYAAVQNQTYQVQPAVPAADLIIAGGAVILLGPQRVADIALDLMNAALDFVNAKSAGRPVHDVERLFVECVEAERLFLVEATTVLGTADLRGSA